MFSTGINLENQDKLKSWKSDIRQIRENTDSIMNLINFNRGNWLEPVIQIKNIEIPEVSLSELRKWHDDFMSQQKKLNPWSRTYGTAQMEIYSQDKDKPGKDKPGKDKPGKDEKTKSITFYNVPIQIGLINSSGLEMVVYISPSQVYDTFNEKLNSYRKINSINKIRGGQTGLMDDILPKFEALALEMETEIDKRLSRDTECE